MSKIYDALILAGRARELEIVRPESDHPETEEIITRPILPKGMLERLERLERENENENALIAATVEVQGFQQLYRAPYVRLTVFGVLLLAALASASVYLSNNARHSLGIGESTVFEGTMQPVAEVKITALVSGIVSRMNTHVGDPVNEGDVLMTMDSRDAEEAVSRAQLAYNAAQRNLARLHGDLAQTEAQVSAASRAASLIPSRQVRDSVQHARVVYDQVLVDDNRNQELYKSGIIAKQVLDNSALALRIAKDDLDNANKGDTANEQVQQLQGQQSGLLSEIGQREQMQQVNEARVALQQASAHLANTRVRATYTGLVSVVSVKVGDQVSVGSPLVVVSRMDRITVNVPVAASMLASLHKFQQAQITLPTVPPQHVLGTIRAVSPVPSANMTHNVEVEFDNPTDQLLAGQPAQVRFVLQ